MSKKDCLFSPLQMMYTLSDLTHYTVCLRRMRHLTFDHDCGKCSLIFKLISLGDFHVKYISVIETSTSPQLCFCTTLQN